MTTYAIRVGELSGFGMVGEAEAAVFTITRAGFKHVFIEGTEEECNELAAELRKLSPKAVAILVGDE